ncbi:hypothetical protein E4U41_007008 [Claviceps citrina]|nr:hypothetical protein E4U41_007008 [Claviceps citrina]
MTKKKKNKTHSMTAPPNPADLASPFQAAAEFKNNGLAPMRRGPGGSIELDLGRLGGVSEGLVVTYEKHGRVVGRSMPRRRSDDGASLESRVLEARNTIFSQELWHELRREARTLAAYDVKPERSKLVYRIDDASRICMELVALETGPLADDSPPGNSSSNGDGDGDGDDSENETAEAISLALHVLLSYAHRYNELMRTRPLPPHISRTRGQQVYALLRPVIARMASARSIRSCTEFVGSVTKALRHAGFASSSFTLYTAPYSVVDATTAARAPNQPAGSQSLVRNTLQPIESSIRWTMVPDTWLTIRSRTFLFPVITTLYHVVLPASSVLHRLCAPFPDGYVDTRALFDYVRTATARVLAAHFLNKLCPPGDGDGPAKWIQAPYEASIRRAGSDDPLEMRFRVTGVAPVALVLSSAAAGPAQDESAGASASASASASAPAPASASWEWTALGGDESPRMEDVVARCAGS